MFISETNGDTVCRSKVRFCWDCCGCSTQPRFEAGRMEFELPRLAGGETGEVFVMVLILNFLVSSFILLFENKLFSFSVETKTGDIVAENVVFGLSGLRYKVVLQENERNKLDVIQ